MPKAGRLPDRAASGYGLGCWGLGRLCDLTPVLHKYPCLGSQQWLPLTPQVNVKALSSGSFQPRPSGFLWVESFISGVRETQGSFPLAVNALSIMESALCPPSWKSAFAGGLCLEFLAESGKSYSGGFVLSRSRG